MKKAVDRPTKVELENELKRVRHVRRFRRILKSTVSVLIVVAALAALVATLILPVIQISGTSMEPTLNNREIVLLVKSKRLQRGDLCAFSYSNKILIKRIIGMPGDMISIDDLGNVIINGENLDEPYLTEKSLGECDIEFPFEVPEESFFIMGDRRDTSIDSRSSVIGCVEREQIIGKIFFRIWPFKKIDFIN
ncbi:MAG: signal peptidase I [Ruminococcaceae bacterium]|nr:signal peptidase I [Oscillospiraceae bacterium]